jgi:hypothetical protein
MECSDLAFLPLRASPPCVHFLEARDSLEVAVKISHLLLLGTLLGAACKDQAPEPPSIEGLWVCPLPSGGNVRFTLGSAGGNTVSGSGTYTTPNGTTTRSMTTTGSYVTPNVSLTFTIETFEAINFTGSHSTATDRMTGALNGSGYNGQSASCDR